MNKPNSRAYNRDVSKRKAKRKQRIAAEVYYDGREYPYYNNLHQYSKNKIHCSCPQCSAKTKHHDKRFIYDGIKGRYNYKHSDFVRQKMMDLDEEDYLFEDNPPTEEK